MLGWCKCGVAKQSTLVSVAVKKKTFAAVLPLLFISFFYLCIIFIGILDVVRIKDFFSLSSLQTLTI